MKKKEVVYPKEVLDVIPEGCYCHGKLTKGKDGKYTSTGDCPFWFKVKGRPHMADAFCVLLGKGDLEINKEAENRKCVVTTCNKGKVVKKETKTYKEWGEPISNVSLLWDRCKECGIKDDYEEGT